MSTILVVEDQAICREPLAKLLRYEAFAVATAANGIEALQVLEHQPIDLLLLDLILPKLSGISLLQQLRRDERFRDLPVIALTGTMDSWLVAQVVELNAKEVFSKMRFSLEDLMKEIRKALPDQRAAPES